MEMRADLLIVGAGMVGSALALALRHSGLEILLLDGGSLSVKPFDADAPFEPRVSALSAASQRILERLGAWDGIAGRRVSPYSDMHVWDGSGTGQIHFSAASVHAQVLGHIVENRVVQDALLETMQRRGGQRLLGAARLERLERTPQGWQLTLDDGRQLNAPLLVAADGANSAVRRLAGCETREWDYLHQAIVASVRCSEPHQRTAWQRFTDDGPLAFLPLERDGDQHWCSIVWSVSPARAHQLQALPEAEFNKTLQIAADGVLGACELVGVRGAVPLKARYARDIIRDGCILVGDAAHTIHPLAGQGVNLGLMDAAALVEAIRHQVDAQRWNGELGFLAAYSRWRKTEAAQMLMAMEAIKRLFVPSDPLSRGARALGMGVLDRFSPLKSLLIRRALGLSGELPTLASPLVEPRF